MRSGEGSVCAPSAANAFWETNRLNLAESLSRCVDIIDLRSGKPGMTQSRGTVVEIGTGWRPFLPFILSLLGAERVITIDVHPWLTSDYALETHRKHSTHGSTNSQFVWPSIRHGCDNDSKPRARSPRL